MRPWFETLIHEVNIYNHDLHCYSDALRPSTTSVTPGLLKLGRLYTRIWHRDSKTADQTCSTTRSSNAAVEYVPQGVHKAISNSGRAEDAPNMTTSTRFGVMACEKCRCLIGERSHSESSRRYHTLSWSLQCATRLHSGLSHQ